MSENPQNQRVGRRLRQAFGDTPLGGVCTSIVHTGRLDPKELQKRGIIKISNNDYIFCGFPSDEGSPPSEPQE